MMKMDRRDLLKLGAVQVFSLALAANTSAHESELTPQKMQNGPSILQGATDESNTQFSILFNSDIPFGAHVTDKHGKIWIEDKAEYITFPNHHKKIAKIFFSNLEVDETYYLNVLNLETNELLDRREFKMLNPNRADFRFALCSCMDDRHHRPEIWRNIASQKPDVIFFIGDFVYADSDHHRAANPERLWKRFCDARQTLDIFFSYQLIPILATWDDHDFGLNDSNSENYPFVRESQKNFNSFFAQEESHCRFLERGPGVSSAFKWDSQLFLLLDDRSFRKPKYSKDRFAHWGSEQEDWMLQLMKENSGPTWVINGSQVFPKLVFKESVSGNHPVQFNGFLKELKKLSSKAIFVSGDVHFSEISKIEKEAIGYNTYEITSSSIHSTNIPGTPHLFPNHRRIAGTGARNYIMVDSVAHGSGAKMHVACCGANGNKIFDLNLTV